MKRQLTETEYQSLIKKSDHDSIIREYKNSIRDIEDSIALTRLQLKLQNGTENIRLNFKEIKLLYYYIKDKTSSLIQSLVNNYPDSVSTKEGFPITFDLKYYCEWSGLNIVESTHINKNGKIIDDRQYEIELNTLTIGSTIQLALCIEAYCNKETPSQSKE